MLGGGANERDAVLFQDFSEAGIFGKKTVTWMNGVSAGNLASGEQPRDVEIAFACGGRTYAHAFVGKPYMHRIGVGRRMDRDRCDAELLAGTLDAKCDLAAICNQNFIEHRSAAYSIIISGSPYSTG